MKLILEHFPELSDQQISQFQLLIDGVTDWNMKINVISRKEMEHLEERHVLHSLAIAKFHQFADNTRLIDVGTGGGFPGLPLAIMFPQCQFTLVDSIGKKIRVVNELVTHTGLKNVTTMNCRAEHVKDTFDFVVSRAVTAYPVLYSWSKGLVSASGINHIKNGMISLKGGDLKQELAPFGHRATIEPIGQWFKEDFFETKSIVYLAI